MHGGESLARISPIHLKAFKIVVRGSSCNCINFECAILGCCWQHLLTASFVLNTYRRSTAAHQSCFKPTRWRGLNFSFSLWCDFLTNFRFTASHQTSNPPPRSFGIIVLKYSNVTDHPPTPTHTQALHGADAGCPLMSMKLYFSTSSSTILLWLSVSIMVENVERPPTPPPHTHTEILINLAWSEPSLLLCIHVANTRALTCHRAEQVQGHLLLLLLSALKLPL